MSALAGPIRDRLRQVLDPETGRDLVAMGMIYGIEESAGHVRITMTTTTRGCPLTELLRTGVEAAIAPLDGVETVEVRLTWDPPWSPDRMEPL